MYIHTLVCFCESRRRFSLFSPLNITYSFFSSLPVPVRPAVFLSVPLLLSPPLPRRVAIRALLSSLPPLLLLPCVPWLPCRLTSLHRARPEALRRPAVLSPLSGCPLVAAVTRPPSGARRYDSGGRCSAYMSPAFCPLAYVLPCVPLPVPWLPSVCPCVCPAAVCRLVVVIGGTPLYPGRRRCGAASGV